MRTIKIQYFKDKRGAWRWHIISSNGKTMATSGESFTRRGKARQSVESMIAHFNLGRYIETEMSHGD